MPDQDTTREAHPDNAGAGFLSRYELWAMGLVLVALGIWWLAGTPGLDNQRPEPAAPTQPSDPPREPLRARLIIQSVRVRPTKANGRRWDVGWNGLPDPRVIVQNLTVRSRVQTRMARDTLEATYDLDAMRVTEGDRLRVRVVDVDLQFDDLIGERKVTVTRKMIEQGKLDWEFGQVESLKLELRRLYR